jgi:ribulose-phosphate 3-epimerase
MPIKVFPSLHAARIGHLQEELGRAAAAGADAIHIDAMDGNVVPNIAFGPTDVAELRELSSLPFDLHLMVADVDHYVPRYIAAGANTLTVHIETAAHPIRILKYIAELGAKAGIAVNPATPISAIEHVLPYVDQVTIMSVDPGYSYQPFLDLAIDKVRALRKLDGPDIPIAVDGGVVPGPIAERLARAGATIFISGSGTFGSSDLQEAISSLKSADDGTY